MNFKNAKVQINKLQPLEDIIEKVKSLGYEESGSILSDCGSYIILNRSGRYTWSMEEFVSIFWPSHQTVSLDDL